MIPVFQDKFYEPGVPEAKQRGNCFSAVIASLLELPLAAVPNFVEIDVLGGPHWWSFANSYIRLKGRELEYFSPRNPPINKYYTVAGISPRSKRNCVIYHIVIFKDGRMVHDPHPDGSGLWTHEETWALSDAPVTG